jgi:1-acyl-sn-glycerol-3-phosphate acyltransferase
MGFFDDTDGIVGTAKLAAGWGLLMTDTTVLGSALLAATALPGGQDSAYRIGRFWCRLNLWVLGTDLHLSGYEHIAPRRPYVVMVNHQSHLDTWVLTVALNRRLRYVMKAELRYVPFLGPGCARLGMIFVERGKRASAIRSMQEAARKVAAGATVVFYPEGTRSADGRLGPFKTGGFRLAIAAGVEILPVSIWGTRHMFPPGSWRFRSGRVDVNIGRPIPTSGLQETEQDLDKLMQRTRGAILDGLLPQAGAR